MVKDLTGVAMLGFAAFTFGAFGAVVYSTMPLIPHASDDRGTGRVDVAGDRGEFPGRRCGGGGGPVRCT